MNSRVMLAWCVAAVAAAGVLRDVSVVFWKAGPLRTTRSQDRFAGLTLPQREKVGFLTDVAGADATRRYYEALFAFAPQVLLPGPDQRLTLADVRDPAQIERICASFGLQVVARGTPGVALLERK